jgi:hypothetical protein
VNLVTLRLQDMLAHLTQILFVIDNQDPVVKRVLVQGRSILDMWANRPNQNTHLDDESAYRTHEFGNSSVQDARYPST